MRSIPGYRIPAILIGSVFLLFSIQAFAPAQLAPDNSAMARIIANETTARLSAQFGLNAEQKLKFEKDVAELLDPEIENDRLHFTGDGELMPDTVLKILVLLKKYSDEDEVQEFQNDLRFLENAREQCGQDSVLWMLDLMLALDAEQTEALTGLLKENWNPVWSSAAGRILYGEQPTADQVYQHLGEEVLKDLLTEKQHSVLTQWAEMYPLKSTIYASDELDESFTDSLVEGMTPLLDAKVDQMKRRFDLNDQQCRRMELALIPCCRQIVGRLNEIIAIPADTPNRARDLWTLSYKPLIQLVYEQPAWKSSVEKILTAEQLEQWEETEARKVALHRELMVDSLAAALSVYGTMSRKEYEEFREEMRQKIPLGCRDRGRFPTSIYMTFVDPAEFVDSLHPENHELIFAQLGSARASFSTRIIFDYSDQEKVGRDEGKRDDDR